LKHEVSQGSILRPLLFITYINGFPLRTNSVSEPILLADDISDIISSRNFEDFCSVSGLVLSHTTELFAANSAVVNLDKTNIMKFITKNSAHSTVHISYEEKFKFRLQHITSPGISQETGDHSTSLQQTYPRQVCTATYHFTWDTLDVHKLQHITSPSISQ